MPTRADSPTKTCTVPDCTKPLRARGMCSTHYNQTRYTSAERHPAQTVPCCVCSTPVLKTSGNASRRSVCSYYCRWFLQASIYSCAVPESHPAHQRWGDPNSRLPVVWTPPPTRGPEQPRRTAWVAGRCRRCGAPFVDRWQGAFSSQSCSPACTKKLARHRRRARQHSAYVANVSPIRIYERDGWRCQICHRKVDRRKVVPHPRAPTIDHIVALANGGTHEPANAQCAHFRCNSLKRDLDEPVQLALFG